MSFAHRMTQINIRDVIWGICFLFIKWQINNGRHLGDIFFAHRIWTKINNGRHLGEMSFAHRMTQKTYSIISLLWCDKSIRLNRILNTANNSSSGEPMQNPRIALRENLLFPRAWNWRNGIDETRDLQRISGSIILRNHELPELYNLFFRNDNIYLIFKIKYSESSYRQPHY